MRRRIYVETSIPSRHLANANKFDHIRRVNGILGLFVPAIVTPLELLGDGNDEE